MVKKTIQGLVEDYESKHKEPGLIAEIAQNAPEAVQTAREEISHGIRRIRAMLEERVRQELVNIIRNSKRP